MVLKDTVSSEALHISRSALYKIAASYSCVNVLMMANVQRTTEIEKSLKDAIAKTYVENESRF